jgi:SAM-dependent methyltransferase
MTLDDAEVRRFWDAQARKLAAVQVASSVTNLEEDPELVAEKIAHERARVLEFVELAPELRVLDLGAGIGAWSLFFAPSVREVVAVEYSEPFVRFGREEQARQGIANVEFVVSPAEAFTADEPFDLAFISGLMIYLNDQAARALVRNLRSLVRPGGKVVLRDGTGVPERHEINDRFSEALQARYSAVYRTREEYVALFREAGCELELDGNMFPEGHRLNKYPETRLRLYRFVRREAPPAHT